MIRLTEKKYKDLEKDLFLDGYVRRAPSPEVDEIDRPIAQKTVCHVCEKGTMTYRPLVRGSQGEEKYSYLAFAVCPCGVYYEF